MSAVVDYIASFTVTSMYSHFHKIKILKRPKVHQLFGVISVARTVLPHCQKEPAV